MKFAVVSWNKKALEQEIRRAGFKVDRKKPDLVICAGGDGTFLFGELAYPGIPKLLLKHRCKKCRDHGLARMCRALEAGRYRIVEKTKVQGTVNRKRLVGLNEINIHYKIPCAIGLDVSVNGRAIARGVMGDGLIVATPWGSTAYFHSITRKCFGRGLGLAFNNPTKPTKPRIVKDSSVVRVKVVKHSGWMASDCNKKALPLKTGDTIEIKKYPKKARIVVLKGRKEKIRLPL